MIYFLLHAVVVLAIVAVLALCAIAAFGAQFDWEDGEWR